MTSNEQYKDISGYDGIYQISNYGKVKSLPRPWRKQVRLLSPLSTIGYIATNKTWRYIQECECGPND